MPKRTGLGRGIGALIPTIEATEDRPSDVFFPKSATENDAPASSAADVAADGAGALSAAGEEERRERGR